jgi:hypothetical protein
MTTPAHSQPPFDAAVTTYASVAETDALLAARPYTEAWDNTSASPSAAGYLVNDPGATLIVGDTAIPVDTGVGDWAIGTALTFDGDATIYTVAAAAASPATGITLAAPGLVSVPANDAAISRLTPNPREAAVMWATSNLDGQWDWVGSQRYPTRGTDTANAGQHQNLRWPRSGAVDLDGNYFDDNTYPKQLVELTAEYTMYLLQRDLASTPEVLGLGFKKAEIPGPLKVEVDPSMTTSMVPDYLWSKYRMLGVPAPGVNPGSMSFVSMRRA